MQQRSTQDLWRKERIKRSYISPQFSPESDLTLFINSALTSMDAKDQLPPDMVEQLLKFTPSSEEKALLEEHSDELKSLARADRFLYEISQ